MLNRDFAGTTARIASTTNITPVEQVNYANALKTFLDEYRTSSDRYEKAQDKALAKSKADALTNAIKGGNQDEINNALASVDPVSYAQMLKSDAQRAEDRKWALDDMATKHQNDLALVRAKDKEATAFQRNFDFIKQTTGLPDDAIVKIMYGGQNPTLNMAMLGKKGQEKVDESRGEKIAEKEDAADKLQQTKDLYNEFFEKGGLISKAQTGGNQPDTLAGRLRGVIQRKLPTDWVKEEAQTARQQIQYGLGNLRLDESSALKGALSDSEQKFLSDMVAGDVQKYSPAQIDGAMQGLMGKLERKAGLSQPSLKSVNSNGTDPFGIR